MKRSKKCDDFLKISEVICCSIIDPEDEGSFNRNGCECCDSLATNTYACNGYAPKTKEVVELGEVCHACLCYFANGVDHPDEDAELGGE